MEFEGNEPAGNVSDHQTASTSDGSSTRMIEEGFEDCLVESKGVGGRIKRHSENFLKYQRKIEQRKRSQLRKEARLEKTAKKICKQALRLNKPNMTDSERTRLMHHLISTAGEEYSLTRPLLVATATEGIRCQLCEIFLPTHHDAVVHVASQPEHRELMEMHKLEQLKLKQTGDKTFYCDLCQRHITGSSKTAFKHAQGKRHCVLMKHWRREHPEDDRCANYM